MKRFFAIFLMVLGLVLLSGAVYLYISNSTEDQQAQEFTEYYLPQLIETIKNNDSNSSVSDSPDSSNSDIPESETDDVTIPDFYDNEMKTVVINGHEFIGYISIPSLNLELPIMAETNYEKLKIAPCRFSGSAKADNLVIGAHNYSRHFGKIGDLRANDEIYFTDMDGNTYKYSVISIEILQPSDADILTNGEYDLTLYTCTYGGRTRITVRCDKTE